MRKVPISSRKARRTQIGEYTTADVVKVTGLTAGQVYRFVRRGLLEPRRAAGHAYRFSFRDIVLLRTAGRLLADGMSPRRTYGALTSLKERMNSASSMTGMRISVDGGYIVYGADGQLWDANTGQGRFNFDIRGLANSVADLKRKRLGGDVETNEQSSDDLYNIAIDLERIDDDLASGFYRKALKLDPKHADAHVNLGRLLQLEGDLERARQHYGFALAVDIDHQIARYNLGTLYDKAGQLEQAIRCYRMAPEVANAHYNLSRIYQSQNDEDLADHHMHLFRQMYDQNDSP